MTLTIESAARKDRTTERATFQHRHFATIADILKRRFTHAPDMRRLDEHGPLRWSTLDICEIFADELGATNPKFDRDRFMRACGFEP